MEWFPVTYHLADKAALVAFPILGYYTGKHHLDDTMLLMWLIAAMPIVAVTAIWAVNELWGWLEKMVSATLMANTSNTDIKM
jgi:hypothetical protein